MTIHAMRDGDLDRLVELEHACFPSSGWSREALAVEIGNASAFYPVATSGGRIVGYAGEWVIMDEAHITTLAVDPKQWGRRYGERLLIALLQEARYRGARRATLEVRASNVAALKLYEKYGFTMVAIRRKYYTDTDEDALILWVNDLFDPHVSALLSRRFGPSEGGE